MAYQYLYFVQQRRTCFQLLCCTSCIATNAPGPLLVYNACLNRCSRYVLHLICPVICHQSNVSLITVTWPVNKVACKIAYIIIMPMQAHPQLVNYSIPYRKIEANGCSLVVFMRGGLQHNQLHYCYHLSCMLIACHKEVHQMSDVMSKKKCFISVTFANNWQER